MGDPKKQKKKYERPLIPWDEKRIEKDSHLMEDYGLRRKEEILKMQSFLRELRRRARDAAAGTSEEEERELLEKCRNIGLIGEEDGINQILRIELRDVLGRRLQTLVSKHEGVKSVDQARQLVVHGHVDVGDRTMKSPSFLVPTELEDKISVDESVLVSE